MADIRRLGSRAALGAVVLGTLLVGGPAWAAPADCGGGEVELLQGADFSTVVGVRLHEVGAECDGQPVGVQFLGNPQGDPQAPATELARAYSDEDPCTGEDQPSGVLREGTVEVLLCEDSTTAPHVDGEQLTRLRLLTTAGSTTVVPPDGPPTPVGDPDVPLGAPDPPAAPAAPGDALPMTGAEILRALLLGGALVLLGGALLRLPERLARR